VAGDHATMHRWTSNHAPLLLDQWDTVEFWLTERCNLTAANLALAKALKWHGRPEYDPYGNGDG
jgi:transposase-like protein